MFKPGDIVKVRAQIDHVDEYEVLGGVVEPSKDFPHPVWTSGGTFDESELMQADPTVLQTISEKEPECAPESGSLLDRIRSLTDGKADAFLSPAACKKIEKALRGTEIDFNGHWKNGVVLREEFRKLDEDFHLFSWALSKEDSEAFLQAREAGTPLDRWVPIELGVSMSSLERCSYCGEKSIRTETNGFVIRLSGKPCKFPKGLPLTEWELNVPSGKLVVANDLRDLFPVMEEDFDINTTLGCRQTALSYAEIGMSHAFIGNSCPGVYECKDGTFKIANEPQDSYWDGDKCVDVDPPPEFDGERLASICTDLWWYSIADSEEYKRRLKRFKRKSSDFRVKYVKVKPGVYRFRHDEEARSYDGPGERVYTRFELVRKPDPVKNLLSLYEASDVNPHAYVHRSVEQYPTLYGKEVTDSAWQRVADHALCTIGNGVDWHERGYPRAKVDPTVKDIDPPEFRRQCHWYPFSTDYSGLFKIELSPSFAKLAFRVLESVISFGTTIYRGASNRGAEVKRAREMMTLAAKRYLELAEQHPTLADPEYVKWLSQTKRVDSWIKNFPFSKADL